MSTPSANMNLVLSTIGVDSGLSWEQNLNASLTTIDSHTHGPGSGVPIQPNGLNITSDLNFQTNNATALRSSRYTAQTAPLATASDLGCVYVSGADLYYNDTAGNQVQITAAGLVNATSSGIGSGTATASFVSGVLVVNAATATPANIQGGSLLLGNNVASSHYVTLSPVNSLASDYTLVLPQIPSSTSFLQIDTSGNITAGPHLLAGLTTSNLSASAGIVGTQLSPSAAILGTQLSPSAAILGTQISASAGIIGGQIAALTLTAGNLVSGTLTGTQMASNINLPGKVVSAAGLNVAVSNTNASQNLAIIRCSFNAAGALLSGEGASVSSSSSGVLFNIAWTTSFGDNPSVCITPINTIAAAATPSVSTSGCQVTLGSSSGFNLIAIGVRA